MKGLSLIVPGFGYVIRSREIRIERDTAPDVLTPKTQKRLTKAIRCDDTVLLVKHAAVCPRCGKELPVYSRNPAAEKQFTAKTPEELERWSSYQTSLYGDEPEEIKFNTPVAELTRFFCPRCREAFDKSGGFRNVVITVRKRRVTVMLRLESADLFKIDWVPQTKLAKWSRYITYEAITFNLNNGHTFLSLESASGRRYAVRDITNARIPDYNCDPVIEIVATCNPVRRALKRFFEPYWNGCMPFSSGEMTIVRYILLTRFVGYDRLFYHAVPCTERENEIEKSFAHTADRLHFASHVPRLFASSGLPKVKSISRTILTSPAWMFYQTELESLWEILQDLNYFRRLFEPGEATNIFETLSVLHRQPACFSFLRDYAEEAGEKKLFRLLAQDNIRWWNYAPVYLSMSEHFKEIEKKKWKTIFSPQSHAMDWAPFGLTVFSIPVPATGSGSGFCLPPDGMVCGYVFTRLSSSREYQQAGTQLHNCLKEYWRMYNGTVYGVVKNHRYIAAVELCGRVIRQAFTFYNRPMDAEGPLFEAYEIWKRNNGLLEAKSG